MNRRVHAKDLALILCLFIGLYVLYTYQTCESEHPVEVQQRVKEDSDVSGLSCYVNRETSKSVGLQFSRKLNCLWDGVEVYVPFSFLKNYFDLFSSFVQTGDTKEFDISHSNSRVVTPSSTYSFWGEFMHFVSFDVEGRSRVLCVSASDGVPVSTQWDPLGYYYPTQIAQFSLSHYSAWIRRKGDTSQDTRFTVQLEKQDKTVAKVRDEETNALVIQFKDNLEFALSSSRLVLSLDLKIEGNRETGFKVVLETIEKEQFVLRYTQSTSFIQANRNEFRFGFDKRANNRWHRLTRDLFTDLKKGLSFINEKKKLKRLKRNRVKVMKLTLYGSGKVGNVSLSEEEDLRMFIDGADWFVGNQDERGGWPSNVIFNQGRKKYPQAEELHPGWYGAMCQGQAISVLCRAYHVTGDATYLEAAEAALEPFKKRSEEGGVKAVFMDKLDWYEEYPTNPSTFILNGFMYSLIGLYDLKQTNVHNSLAKQLYDRGMKSLTELLPFYDAGSSTFYDLRHFTMKTTPKIARWDYHSTHINQLLLLSTIDNSSILFNTAERWRGYMVGKRAPHN